jgi:oligopeptide transport system substrate-binding protein
MRAICLLGLLCLAGCGRKINSDPIVKTTRADVAMAEGILLRGNGSDPESLDPHLATSVSAGKVLINLFEGLTRLNPETLIPEPGVAERWTFSDDRKTITFFFRASEWSDGEPVKASDFVFAFRRLLDPDLAASYAFMLHPLLNAQAVSRGELPVESLGVKALDDRTLEIQLEQPTPYILALLAHWTAFPLPEHVLTRFGTVSDRASEWTRTENFVVNGAFTLKEWIPEKALRIRKNPGYWQADVVRLNGADYIPYESTTEERAFRGGEIHVTYSLPAKRLDHYRANEPEVLRLDTYLESVAYVVNVRKPALQDVRVRRALALAVDRTILTDGILKGVGKPAWSYVPPGTGGYHPVHQLEDNLDEAKRLLAEAGYPGGEGFPELELLVFSGPETESVATAVQQMWKQGLGIQIQINNLEKTTYFSERREGDFDLCFLGWVGDYVDPLTFLGLWQSEAGNNLAGWKNAEYDALLSEAALSENRMKTLAEAEGLLVQEVPVIPLYYGTTQFLKDARVQGWYPNLLDQHPLRAVGFDSAETKAD